MALLIGGIVMWVVDALSVRRDLKTKDVEQMTAMPGGLDRPMGGHLGCFSWRVALDVDDCRGTGGRHDPHGGARIQLPGIHPRDDCGDRL